MSYAALPVLRTPRLTLRPLFTGDAEAIVAGIGNYDVVRWLGSVPYPYGREDALWFIDRAHRENRMVWAVCDAEGLQGVCGIEEEFGYWLARPAWGRGYGFEAGHTALTHWFSDPARGEVESGYFNENTRSQAILRALGFEKTGAGPRFSKSLNQQVPSTDVGLTRTRWQARQRFEVTTKRLVLTPLAQRHASDFAAMTVQEVTRNLARVKSAMTVEEAQADLERRRWRGLPGFTLAIERDGCFAGILGIDSTPLSIGYALHPDHWGQGLMTEALAAFLPELFERFPLNRLTADHFTDNPASGAVLRKFGFQATGREMATSKGRLEPAPVITYALERNKLRVLP